jgi:leader peptidase (prepilin peptidase)/N-methyltransferase
MRLAARRASPTPRSSSSPWPGRADLIPLTLTPLGIVLAIAGLLLGLAADRLATRWPEHDEEHRGGRPMGWRTVVTAVLGAIALGLLPQRFAGDPLAFALFGAWFAVLVVGLATDLDQRLLPDVLMLPVIPIALVFAVSGRNPLVGGEILPAVLAAIVIPLALYLPSLPFGAGAFGIGDVKLLLGSGLMVGFVRAFAGLLFGLLVSGLVLGALLVSRRIGRRSYVPFGPFLIIGLFWAVLLKP